MRRFATTCLILTWCFALPGLAQTAQSNPPSPNAPTRYPLDAFTEFSAVMVGSRFEPPDQAHSGHIYRSGKLLRMEDPGQIGFYITDLSTGETYGISENGCIHDTHPFMRAFPFEAATQPGITVSRTTLGQETLDGHACRIDEVAISSDKLGNVLKMKLWEADDLHGFPIKIDFPLSGGHDAIIRYENVILAPQDPTLFIHPKSCSAPGSTSHAPQ